jgi:hypothetical protein
MLCSPQLLRHERTEPINHKDPPPPFARGVAIFLWFESFAGRKEWRKASEREEDGIMQKAYKSLEHLFIPCRRCPGAMLWVWQSRFDGIRLNPRRVLNLPHYTNPHHRAPSKSNHCFPVVCQSSSKSHSTPPSSTPHLQPLEPDNGLINRTRPIHRTDVNRFLPSPSIRANLA